MIRSSQARDVPNKTEHNKMLNCTNKLGPKNSTRPCYDGERVDTLVMAACILQNA